MRGWVKAEEVTPGKWWQIRDGTLRRRDPSGYISFVREGDLFWKRGRPLPDDPRWLPASAAIAEWGEQGGSKGWWFYDTPNTGDIGRWTGRLTVVHFGMFIPRGRPPLPNALEQSPRSEKEHPSAIMCEHANENPHICKCPPDCYCRTRTCKDKGYFEDAYGLERPGWLKCKRCLSSMLEANTKTHVCNPAHVVFQPQGPQEWTPEQVKAFNELKPGPIKPFDTGVRMATYAVIPLETHRKRLEEFLEIARNMHQRFPDNVWGKRFNEEMQAELARLLEVE